MKLNSQSQKLYDRIHSIPVDISKLFPYHFHLQPNAKKLIFDIYKKMYDAYIGYNISHFQKISYSDFTKSDLITYLPDTIHSHLIEIKKTTVAYSFTINGHVININMMFTNNFSRTHTISTKDYIEKSLKLIYIWFSIATQYSSQECGKEINIFLYFTDFYKKKPDKKGEQISAIHANTAYTRSCSPKSTIQIFREEEWFKVLIHESFHNLGLDFSTMNIEICKKYLTDWFSVSSEGLLFETYCETWANIINNLFVCFYFEFVSMNNHTFEQLFSSIFKKFEETMIIESKFAIFQSAKVLQHMNLTYTDLVDKTSLSISYRDQYKENTNVLCYYVIKSLMLFHLNDFLNWCFLENNGSLNFKKTQDNLKNFCFLIKKNYKDPKYMKLHEKITSYIDHSSNEFVDTTLRMTLFG